MYVCPRVQFTFGRGAGESGRVKFVEKLFGKPNFGGKEWHFVRENNFEIRVWTFNNKLVIVEVLPDTEWAEDAN